MPIPARLQVFGLASSRDVLQKLEWEIERYKSAPSEDAAASIHIAFNIAVTAWRMCDRIDRDLTTEQRSLLGVAGLSQLKKKSISESRVVEICRLLATASKHVEVDKYPDPGVQT